MNIVSMLNLGSALCAFAAAGLWFWSSRVKIPSSFPIEVTSLHAMSEQIIGAQVVSSGSSAEIDDMARALIWQSRLSSWAALAAGLAAFLQVMAALF